VAGKGVPPGTTHEMKETLDELRKAIHWIKTHRRTQKSLLYFYKLA